MDIGHGFFKDCNNIYRLNPYNENYTLLDLPDYESFVPLRFSYSKDSQNVYLHRGLVPRAEPDSFTVLNSRYTKDRNHVFVFLGDNISVIDGVHVDSFTVFKNDKSNSAYAKDMYRVYYFDDVIENASPETFQVISENQARDGKHLFFGKNIVSS